MKTISLSIILLVVLSSTTSAQKSDQQKFYDFSIVVDYTHGLQENDYKFVLSNIKTSKAEFENNRLYTIKYTYSKNGKRLPTDTLSYSLNRAQMDSLFKFTSQLFQFPFQENSSENKIPPPPAVNDGMTVSLTLDLGFRGDKFERSIKYPAGTKYFSKLDSLLKANVPNL